MFITSTANYNRIITIHRRPDLPTYIHIHSGRRGVTFSWVSWSLSGNNPLQMSTELKQKMQLMSTWVFEFDTQILFDDPSRCNAITSWWVQGRQRGCHRAGKGSKEEGSVACIAILCWEGRVVVELNYINDDDALMYSKELQLINWHIDGNACQRRYLINPSFLHCCVENVCLIVNLCSLKKLNSYSPVQPF